ncbi:MAG: prepilin-type N-terminal cleavage/methylation domain-containing protein [Pseudomonadota bacterium]
MKKGFTLVELSIVMVIIGLLIGGSMQGLRMMRDRAKVLETKQQLDALKEAIYGYALNTNTLPATLADLNSTALERDSWGNTILYRPDAALLTDPCRPASTLSTTSGDFIQTDIAFILVSRGKDYSIAHTTLGLDTPLFNQRDHDSDPATSEYDDHFLSITRAQLQSNINCQQNELQILNSRLPIATQGVSYSGTIASSGGNGTYAYTYNGAATTTINGVTFTNIAGNGTYNGSPIIATSSVIDIVVTSAGQTRTRSFILTVDSNGS